MHKKQIVIKRKYFEANKNIHAWYSVSFFVVDGGFNNFSMFSGMRRLFVIHAVLMIKATSAVRPLHSNHLGDSGITNLKIGQSYGERVSIQMDGGST